MENKDKKKWGPFSIISVCTGLASLCVAGLYSSLLGLIAVVLGVLGMRRRERGYITGVLLGSIALISVNLQDLGIIRGVSETKRNIEHVFSTIIISNRSFEILKNHKADTKMSDEEIDGIVRFLEKAIEEAQKTDVDTIDREISGFGRHYRDEFIEGLKLIVTGYENSNFGQQIQGAVLIEKWAKWNNQNRDRFKAIKEKKLSVINLLSNLITP